MLNTADDSKKNYLASRNPSSGSGRAKPQLTKIKTLRVDDKLFKSIQKYARQQRCSISDVLRSAANNIDTINDDGYSKFSGGQVNFRVNHELWIHIEQAARRHRYTTSEALRRAAIEFISKSLSSSMTRKKKLMKMKRGKRRKSKP